MKRCLLFAAAVGVFCSATALAANADDPLLHMVELRKMEYRIGGEESIAWKVDAWLGRDLRKVWLTLDGDKNSGTTSADFKLLYVRAIAPHWDVRVGVKHDFSPGTSQNWTALIIDGLAPYRIEVKVDFYVASSGQAALEFEFSHDYRISRQWVLHPKLEIDMNRKTDAGRLIGSGISDMELSLRLRYEIRREIAPYFGIHYSKLFGDTADIAVARDDETSELQLLAGLRAWF